MGCGSSNAGSLMRQQQQQQMQLQNQAVGQINNAFSGFTPQFYQGIQNAATNYWTPQLYQQYLQNSQGLGYNLANRGLLNSTAAQQGQQQLSGAMNQASNQIGNQAVQASQNLQNQVGQEQANLIGQAESATNPLAKSQGATGAASQFLGPSSFAPLGNMFGQFGNLWLANQAQQAYSPYYAGTGQNQMTFPSGGMSSFVG